MFMMRVWNFDWLFVLDQEVEEGDEGAQTSAAWCLSAVLLFMSMLLLRQAFEPPVGGAEVAAPGPSRGSSGQLQSYGDSLVHPSMPAEALTGQPVPAYASNSPHQVIILLATSLMYPDWMMEERKLPPQPFVGEGLETMARTRLRQFVNCQL